MFFFLGRNGKQKTRRRTSSRSSASQARRAVGCTANPQLNGVHLVTKEKEEARSTNPDLDQCIDELQQGKCVVVRGSTSVLMTPAKMATTESEWKKRANNCSEREHHV